MTEEERRLKAETVIRQALKERGVLVMFPLELETVVLRCVDALRAEGLL